MDTEVPREIQLQAACREIKAALDAMLPAKLVVSASIQVGYEWPSEPLATALLPGARNTDAILCLSCGGTYFTSQPERAIEYQSKAHDLIDEKYKHLFYIEEWRKLESEAVSEERVPDSAVLSGDDFAARMRGKRRLDA